MLLMKVENPDFFFPSLESLVSSENLFGVIAGDSPTRGADFSLILSPAEKLADCRNVGLNMRGSGLVLACARGGGGGRRNEF